MEVSSGSLRIASLCIWLTLAPHLCTESCKYRHALPPGFVLKPKGKKKEDDENPNAISIEEFLEVERHKLPAKLTPVTPESFAEWKKNRVDKKAAEQDALKKSKETQIQAGKAGGMSGRDLFEFSTVAWAQVCSMCGCVADPALTSPQTLSSTTTLTTRATTRTGTLRRSGSVRKMSAMSLSVGAWKLWDTPQPVNSHQQRTRQRKHQNNRHKRDQSMSSPFLCLAFQWHCSVHETQSCVLIDFSPLLLTPSVKVLHLGLLPSAVNQPDHLCC